MKRTKQEEKCKIGLWLSTSLVVGNMTGSGIFLLPAALALYGGISLFGWLLTVSPYDGTGLRKAVRVCAGRSPRPA